MSFLLDFIYGCSGFPNIVEKLRPPQLNDNREYGVDEEYCNSPEEANQTKERTRAIRGSKGPPDLPEALRLYNLSHVENLELFT